MKMIGELLEKAKTLPEKPGVYFMKDSNGIIIYIGKSKNLKNRVSSYFYNLKDRSSKIENLVNNIRVFDYALCDNELDALLLENRLIKKHKPRYNSLLKKYNSYPYIVIKRRKEVLEISWEYEVEDSYDYIFGPFNSSSIVDGYVRMVNLIYKLKRCSNFRGNKCLEFHMNNCLAPCSDNILLEDYNSIFEDIIDHLEGNGDEPIKKAQELMLEASMEMDFKRAAEIRDLIQNSKHLINQKDIVQNKNKGYSMFLADTVGGDKKAYLLKDLNVIHSEIIGKIDRDDLMARFKEITSQMEYIAIDSLRESMDEKLIVYSFLKNNGELYKIV